MTSIADQAGESGRAWVSGKTVLSGWHSEHEGGSVYTTGIVL